MYPERHVKAVKYSRWTRKFFKNFNIVGLFVLTLFLLGPLIHELSHIAWLKYESCFYNLRMSLGWMGIYGAVKPVCHLSDTSLIVFYSSGFVSTLFAGAFLNFIAIELRNSISHHSYLLSAGTGLMLSVVVGLISKGDFAEAFRILGFKPVYAGMFSATLMVLIFVSNFKSIDLIISELEWEE